MTRTLTLATLLAVAVAGCARSGDSAGDGPRVVPLAGQVTLAQGGESILLDEETTLEPDAVVATQEGGRALVSLGAGQSVELGPRAEVRLDGFSAPELTRGSILARTTPAGLQVRSGDAELEGRSAVFRVDRGFSTTLAVYRGEASVIGSGVAPVSALRQATVVAGGEVPRGPGPLEVRLNDPWDIRLLGPAIDAGIELVKLERGLTPQLAGEDGVATVASILANDFPARALGDALERLGAAEAVIAAEVAREAAELTASPLTSILQQVSDLRREGAHWIVVLAQWKVIGDPLFLELGRLAGLIARRVAPLPAAILLGGSSGGGSGGSVGQSGSTSDGAGGADGTSTDTTPTTTTGDGSSGGDGGGGGGGSSPPPPGCQNPVDCVVDDLVGELEGPGLPQGAELPRRP